MHTSSRHRRKYTVFFIIEGLLVILLSILLFQLLLRPELSASAGPSAGPSTEFSEDTVFPSLSSRCFLLTELSSGCEIAAQNAQDRIYPASMTKIMTALLAIERTADFSVVVTVPVDIFDAIYAADASTAGFEPGESATLEELLYGILLPSGSECCLTYARFIAGSEEAFVQLMNERAQELGMNDTHFDNCTGLPSENHYSTVRDMSILLRYALSNDTFRQVITSASFSVSPSAVHPDGFTLQSTLFHALQQVPVPEGVTVLGGKTGHTDQAGLCLASFALAGGREYMLVTADAPGSDDTPPYHVMDAVSVYGYLASLPQ